MLHDAPASSADGSASACWPAGCTAVVAGAAGTSADAGCAAGCCAATATLCSANGLPALAIAAAAAAAAAAILELQGWGPAIVTIQLLRITLV